MPHEIVEILSPNLPADLKQYRTEERWAAYIHAEHLGELTTYPEALREAIALGAEGCVAFVPENYSPAAPVKRSRK